MQLIWVCPTVVMGNRALNLPIIKPDSHLQQGVAPRWEPVSRELWSAERNCQAININRPNRAGERRSDQNSLEGKALHCGQRRGRWARCSTSAATCLKSVKGNQGFVIVNYALCCKSRRTGLTSCFIYFLSMSMFSLWILLSTAACFHSFLSSFSSHRALTIHIPTFFPLLTSNLSFLFFSVSPLLIFISSIFFCSPVFHLSCHLHLTWLPS